MKICIYLCLAVTTSLLFGAKNDLPSDVQWLVSKRSEAVEKIDRTFVKELEKLKVKYTKKGDLDSALVVSAIIKRTDNNANTGLNLFDGLWIAGIENGKTWGLRVFQNGIMIDQNGGKHEVTVSRNKITIDWGAGNETLVFDPNNPDIMRGKSGGRWPIVYKRIK